MNRPFVCMQLLANSRRVLNRRKRRKQSGRANPLLPLLPPVQTQSATCRSPRFMASTHVRILEVSPTHESLFLSGTLRMKVWFC